uniref:Uncharacterized protein n=1 Tax=Panthera tigris altaica TaxID=74533 RepID=A0A8C9KL94_PANTA
LSYLVPALVNPRRGRLRQRGGPTSELPECGGLIGRGWGGILTNLLSSCPQEALPGLIWDLGQQLGDLSLESGGLEQESGRSSGFYEDPSSTGGPDSPPSTFCGDSGFSGSGSYGRLGPAEPRGIYASERPKSLGKVEPGNGQ